MGGVLPLEARLISHGCFPMLIIVDTNIVIYTEKNGLGEYPPDLLACLCVCVCVSVCLSLYLSIEREGEG